MISDKILEMLADRGLDPELVVRKGASSIHRSDLGGEALVIPFHRKARVVRRKYRTFGPEKRFSQSKGGVRCAYNEDCLRDDSLIPFPLVITEGELDQWSAEQAGFLRSISVPDGAPPPPKPGEERDAGDLKKYDWLQDLLKEGLLSKDRVTTILLATDGDDNGAALLQDLAVQLGRARCKFLTYPLAKDPEKRGRARLKDLNEVLEDYGERGVVETLNAAQPMVTGVCRMSELPPEPEGVIYEVGDPAIDDLCKFRLKDFSVWTGIPGMGKTTVVQDLVCRLVKRYEIDVTWASFEQNPQRDHKRAFRTWFLEKRLRDQTEADWAAADAWIDRFHSFIVPTNDDDVTLDWMLERMESAVLRYGSRVIIADPWNEMDHARLRHESETEYTGRAIKTLKKFANAFNVHLAIVAHPAKLQVGKDGKLPIPTLYDISGSAHWFNKPDLGFVVHRDGEKTLLRNCKSRYHDIIGRPGQVKMAFVGQDRRFRVEERN